MGRSSATRTARPPAPAPAPPPGFGPAFDRLIAPRALIEPRGLGEPGSLAAGPAGDLPPDGDPEPDPGSARHRSLGSRVSRRRLIGLIGSGAVASACGAAVAPTLVGGAADLLGPGHTPGAFGTPGAVTAAGATPSTGASTATPPVATGTQTPSTTSTRTKKTDYQGAAAGKPPKAKSTATVRQLPTVLSLDPALHLARRAAWGPTPALVKEIRSMGEPAWVERQLRPATIPDPVVDSVLARFDALGKTAAQIRAMNPSHEQADYFYAHTQLEQAAIARAAWSNRQLFEVIVDFLHSRLHVPAHLDKSRDALNHYDSAVIRRGALGTFSDLVWAMVTHPAMILYLDNQNNTKDGGNQNLGRELLELHTLGVDAGYTQNDVAGSAKLLTGLGVTDDGTAMLFRPEQHAVGPVRVFGRTYPNATAAGGLATIKTYIHDLTHHPATAAYFSLDLARRFVADAPSAALVKRLAAAYLKNGTAIAPLVRIVLASPEFKAGVGQKYRRPLENTVAAIRALGLNPAADQAKVGQALQDLRYNLDQMGQAPLGRTSPDGFPDFAQPWLSSLGVLSRWNMHMSLAGSWRDGLTQPALDAVLGSARTYGQAVDALLGRLLFQRSTAAQRATLLTFLGKPAAEPLTADARRNDYNLRVRVPALILGAPEHQLR